MILKKSFVTIYKQKETTFFRDSRLEVLEEEYSSILILQNLGGDPIGTRRGSVKGLEQHPCLN